MAISKEKDIELLTEQVSQHLQKNHKDLLLSDDPTKSGAFDTKRQEQLESVIRVAVQTLLNSSDLEIENAVISNIIGLGVIDPLLQDDAITEIMINGPHDIWIEKNGLPRKTDLKYKDVNALLVVIYRIAHSCGRRVNLTNPELLARLPNGFRVHVFVPMASHFPVVNIRCHHTRVFTTQEYIDMHYFSHDMAIALKYAVWGKLNIIVCGTGGVGKTLFQRWLAQHIPPTERVITIEDTFELRLEMFHPHVIALEAGENISMYRLTDGAMKMRADRIFIGEAISEEFMVFLLALLTGHVGCTSMHTYEGREAAIGRIVQGAARANNGYTRDELQRLVLDTIDLMIFVKKFPEGSRHITHITEVGNKDGQPDLNDIFLFNRQENKHTCVASLSPQLLDRITDNLPLGESLPDIPCFRVRNRKVNVC